MAIVSVAQAEGCNFEQPITVADIRKVFTETNDLITACSYKKMSINLRQLQVSSIPSPPDRSHRSHRWPGRHL